jgi:hypothetical protein
LCILTAVFYLTKVKINKFYKDETVGCAWTPNTNAKVNKPFKTHVRKGETSVPSRPSFHVLMNTVMLKHFDKCFQNVLWTFLTVLWTFLTVLWTFLTVLSTFLTVLSTFSERFWPFRQHFQNVLSTCYKHFWTCRKRLVKCLFERFVNVHTVRILCIVRKLLTRPFQRHLTWWGTWLTSKTSLQVI